MTRCIKCDISTEDTSVWEKLNTTQWLCRNCIWDSQTVSDLFLKQSVQDEYRARKANPPAKIQALRDFMASNPSNTETIIFLNNFNKNIF